MRLTFCLRYSLTNFPFLFPRFFLAAEPSVKGIHPRNQSSRLIFLPTMLRIFFSPLLFIFLKVWNFLIVKRSCRSFLWFFFFSRTIPHTQVVYTNKWTWFFFSYLISRARNSFAVPTLRRFFCRLLLAFFSDRIAVYARRFVVHNLYKNILITKQSLAFENCHEAQLLWKLKFEIVASNNQVRRVWPHNSVFWCGFVLHVFLFVHQTHYGL